MRTVLLIARLIFRPTHFVHLLSFFLLAKGKVRRKSPFLKRIQGQTEESKIRSQRCIENPNAKYFSFDCSYQTTRKSKINIFSKIIPP